MRLPRMGLLLPYFLHATSDQPLANWTHIGTSYLQLVQLFGIVVLTANRFSFALFSRRVYGMLWSEWGLLLVLALAFIVPFALTTPLLYIKAYYFHIKGPAAIMQDDLLDNDSDSDL